jgi:hypothetical protein
MMLDKWELLSSMQALLIYMMLRVQEGENMYNNFDVLLLSAMWVRKCGFLAPIQLLTQISGHCMFLESQDRQPRMRIANWAKLWYYIR